MAVAAIEHKCYNTIKEQMFENSHCAATYFVSDRRYCMDYKKKIITLLEKVRTESTLKRVYKLLEYLYLKEN